MFFALIILTLAAISWLRFSRCLDKRSCMNLFILLDSYSIFDLISTSLTSLHRFFTCVKLCFKNCVFCEERFSSSSITWRRWSCWRRSPNTYLSILKLRFRVSALASLIAALTSLIIVETRFIRLLWPFVILSFSVFLSRVRLIFSISSS